MLWVTAWRNLWRNKRRTLIIIAAITVGLIGAQASMALTNTWLRQMMENSVGLMLGRHRLVRFSESLMEGDALLHFLFVIHVGFLRAA